MWSEVFGLQGKLAAGGKRWSMRKEDVKYIGKNGVARLLLLSDDYCNRPKFLMALAFGIPCISFDWLEASASSNVSSRINLASQSRLTGLAGGSRLVWLLVARRRLRDFICSDFSTR